MLVRRGQRDARRRAIYDGVLSIPAGTRGEWAVEHIEHPTGHVFNLSNARTAIMGGHTAGSVAYDHPTTWHRLTQGGGVWMSDYPIEQAQHDRELAGFNRGCVLVGGLGLGYAATALAKRPGITEVVVVEIAQEVIDLVAPHLLRDDAGARRKLRVERADLFNWLRGCSAQRHFDHAFYDIWTSDGEGTFFETVVPLLRLSRGVVRREPVCWNESVMRGQLCRSVMSRWTMLSFPGAPTLDQLCEPTGRVWHDWMVPFFRWARREKPEQETFDKRARLYAGGYGRRSFPGTWVLLTGEEVAP